LSEVLKVIYAPQKAFKEILQKPTYIGPILIMILFIATNTGSVYTLLSKTHIEQTMPTTDQGNIWSENKTYWTSTPDVNITENTVDFINGTYYGNKSIQFSAVNTNRIIMLLNNMGSVNCTGPDGYKNFSLRVKWTSPMEKPSNATVYLFSSSPADYFYHNLTMDMANSMSDIWNNFTLPLVTDKWSNNNTQASWGNITGLKLEFTWAATSNVTMLIDGLFFRGLYQGSTENINTVVPNIMTRGLMQFVLIWVILGGLLYILSRTLGAKTVWKPTLIVAGFALVTMFVQSVISLVTFSTLPNLYYTLEYVGGTQAESLIAQVQIAAETSTVSMIYGYLQVATYLWTVMLCAVAAHLLATFSWGKSFLVATVAYLISIMVEGFLLGI